MKGGIYTRIGNDAQEKCLPPGEQPILHPGDSFDYTSGTPLSTPSGIMVGNYHMLTEGGDQFDVAIPPFPLECPHAERVIN